METIAATEASNRFGKLLDLARQEPVTIEKKGRQVAVILSVEEYNRMENTIEDLQDQRLKESIADMEAGRVEPAAEVFASLKERYK
ncbi:type II toxin-antitoxin system Phd/YefM family antitoxin [Persicirhabdus sediminis]|uniref:Antitoxin n=1 Tax=Persicirhabdus sediminis TaxID=454144 RepID=A0A8J7MET9_9BACT|nr:type II toxin-antitoxin system Phd/YefM family antitoxin [Persicirhabdus sediminis]MBK1792021.1 type II toxin-antitoxin system Phd/YefM family antitoxin [Persicirhabdus sediminis]